MHDHAVPIPDTSGQAGLEAAADRAAIAAILEARGRPVEALRALQEAAALLEHVLGKDHFEVGVALDQLASRQFQGGQGDEAEELYGRALAIFERTLGHQHPRTVTCRTNRDKALRGPHP